jgi:hypothetical protein
MLNQALNSIRSAFRGIVTKPRAVLLAFLIYVLLIGMIWVFVTTREATIADLLITLVSAILVVTLFFVLQAIAVGYGEGLDLKALVVGLLRDSTKLLLVSLPVIAVAVVVYLAANRLTPEPYEPKNFFGQTLLPAIKAIVFWLILPLLAIRLWIVTARKGLRAAYARIGRILIESLAPGRVLTFALVALITGAIVYLLIYQKTAIDCEWVEISILAARIALASIVIFLGWFLGVRALSELNKA